MRRRPVYLCVEHRPIELEDECPFCSAERAWWVAGQLLEEVEALLPPEIAEAWRDDYPQLGAG